MLRAVVLSSTLFSVVTTASVGLNPAFSLTRERRTNTTPLPVVASRRVELNPTLSPVVASENVGLNPLSDNLPLGSSIDLCPQRRHPQTTWHSVICLWFSKVFSNENQAFHVAYILFTVDILQS